MPGLYKRPDIVEPKHVTQFCRWRSQVTASLLLYTSKLSLPGQFTFLWQLHSTSLKLSWHNDTSWELILTFDWPVLTISLVSYPCPNWTSKRNHDNPAEITQSVFTWSLDRWRNPVYSKIHRVTKPFVQTWHSWKKDHHWERLRKTKCLFTNKS